MRRDDEEIQKYNKIMIRSYGYIKYFNVAIESKDKVYRYMNVGIILMSTIISNEYLNIELEGVEIRKMNIISPNLKYMFLIEGIKYRQLEDLNYIVSEVEYDMCSFFCRRFSATTGRYGESER